MKLIFAVTLSCFLSALSKASSLVRRETGCPPEEDIEPCFCYSSAVLTCEHLNSDDVLRNIFRNTARCTFNQVEISYSSLSYLPHEMFENTTIQQIILTNVTMAQLFDKTHVGSSPVDKLHLENTHFQRQLSWEFLDELINLKVLTIYSNRIKILGKAFSEHVSEKLEQLALAGTETKKIQPGALVKFDKLLHVIVSNCLLTTLTRDIFPNPFNVLELNFNNNKISSIPDDLFTNMPKLEELKMQNNLITAIPESAFTGTPVTKIDLMFNGNPFKCDCLLVWLVRSKPYLLYGSCDRPNRLKDKELQDLTPYDFNC